MIDADDSILVEQVRNGCREAFDKIDRRYRHQLCRFLTRHAMSRHRAEELAQAVLIQAFETIPTWKPDEQLAPWLYTQAFRQISRESVLPLSDEPPSAPHELPDERFDPAKLAEERDETDNLWLQARDALKPDEYKAVWLKYVDGLKITAIARIMGRTKISVRVLLFRARRKLLPLLNKHN